MSTPTAVTSVVGPWRCTTASHKPEEVEVPVATCDCSWHEKWWRMIDDCQSELETHCTTTGNDDDMMRPHNTNLFSKASSFFLLSSARLQQRHAITRLLRHSPRRRVWQHLFRLQCVLWDDIYSDTISMASTRWLALGKCWKTQFFFERCRNKPPQGNRNKSPTTRTKRQRQYICRFFLVLVVNKP